MKNRWTQFIFVSILILGFVLRLYKIGNPIADWHSFRQSDTAAVARLYVEKGIDLLKPEYYDISRVQSGLFNPEGYRFVEFPLYNALQAFLAKSFTFVTLEVWGRLLSIFSALGSALLLYLLGKRYISTTGGLLAMGFYLLNPYNVYFTRVILPEPLAVFLALASLYWFSEFIVTEKARFIFLCSLAFALSVLVKPYTIFYSLPMLVLALEKYSPKYILRNKNFIFAFTIAILPLILWRLWIRQFPEGIPFWKWTFNGDGIRFKPAFWYWIFGERLTKLILGFWGLIPFAFGLISYKRQYKLVHSFLVGALLFVIVFATASVKHDYYQSIIIPSVSLIFSLGFIKLWNQREFDVRLTRIVALFSVFMMFVAGAFQVKEFYKINHPEIIEAGAAVDRTTPKDSVVIAAYNGDTAFLYQTKRKGYPNVELPIDELIAEGAQYYTSVDLSHPQTKEFMTRFKVVEKTDKYVILDLKEEQNRQ